MHRTGKFIDACLERQYQCVAQGMCCPEAMSMRFVAWSFCHYYIE